MSVSLSVSSCEQSRLCACRLVVDRCKWRPSAVVVRISETACRCAAAVSLVIYHGANRWDITRGIDDPGAAAAQQWYLPRLSMALFVSDLPCC